MKTLNRIILYLQSLPPKKIYLYLLIPLSMSLLILVYMLLYPYVSAGRDWGIWFRPAIILLFSGKTPYTIPIPYPPWALLALAPLALLPPKVGSIIFVMISPIMFGLIANRLGAKLLPTIFFALSSPVIHNAVNNNIDWLPALGLLMPPQIGLFFVLIKPQVGIGVAIYWLFEAWQKNRVKGVIRVFWPVTVAYLVSFVLFGNWLLSGTNASMQLAQQHGEADLFPWAVPLGLAILFYALRKKLQTLSISASPLLSPYVAMHSWSSFLLGLVNYPALSITACILSWVITFWGWSLRP
jgi:hypothetical protein